MEHTELYTSTYNTKQQKKPWLHKSWYATSDNKTLYKLIQKTLYKNYTNTLDNKKNAMQTHFTKCDMISIPCHSKWCKMLWSTGVASVGAYRFLHLRGIYIIYVYIYIYIYMYIYVPIGSRTKASNIHIPGVFAWFLFFWNNAARIVSKATDNGKIRQKIRQ